jgi:flagellin-like protein
MFERLTNDEERGQVGIGTLIVFIALVLVAAIAAGVLINTAGFLQTQAEQTGEQSSEQVTDRLEQVSVNGSVDPVSEDISNMSFVLQKSPGASDINISASTLTFVGPDETLRFEVGNDNVFDYGTYQDTDGSLDKANPESDLILNDQGDQLVLRLDMTATSHDNLETSEEATVRLTGESGATTTIRVSVPNSLAGDEDVTL